MKGEAGLEERVLLAVEASHDSSRCFWKFHSGRYLHCTFYMPPLSCQCASNSTNCLVILSFQVAALFSEMVFGLKFYWQLGLLIYNFENPTLQHG